MFSCFPVLIAVTCRGKFCSFLKIYSSNPSIVTSQQSSMLFHLSYVRTWASSLFYYSCSSLVQFKKSREYLTRDTSQVFIHLIRFQQFGFKTFYYKFLMYFLILLHLFAWCYPFLTFSIIFTFLFHRMFWCFIDRVFLLLQLFQFCFSVWTLLFHSLSVFLHQRFIINTSFFFTPASVGGLSQESEWQRVSWDLQDSSEYSSQS